MDKACHCRHGGAEQARGWAAWWQTMAAVSNTLNVNAATGVMQKPTNFWQANPRTPYWMGGELTAATGSVAAGNYDLGLVFEEGRIMRVMVMLRTKGGSASRCKLKLGEVETIIYYSPEFFSGSGSKSWTVGVPGSAGDTTVLPLGGYPVALGDRLSLEITLAGSGAQGLSCWVLIAPNV